MDAAKELARDPDVKLYLVADASLRLGGRREFTDPADIQLLGHWVHRGLVEELPDADERLLELCEYTGIPVITGDRFRGNREERPWLQGNTDDFLEPVPARHGTVRLVPVDLGVASALDISRKLEEDALKKMGLLGPRRTPRFDVVSRNWRCEEGRCTLYDTHKGTAALLPRMVRGVPHCQSHGRPLLDDGPRTATVQLKLLVEGELKARFTLEDGSTVKVGRAPGEGGIALHGLVPERRTVGLRACRAAFDRTADADAVWCVRFQGAGMSSDGVSPARTKPRARGWSYQGISATREGVPPGPQGLGGVRARAWPPGQRPPDRLSAAPMSNYGWPAASSAYATAAPTARNGGRRPESPGRAHGGSSARASGSTTAGTSSSWWRA
ncbi:FHA domain-containing protein [Streptomyces sp. NPDC047515]|uniref:FHA domain-containing protein n=1 Tax=Streptomyces sp. NPDC047515 TaxID=3155380 RepID=UPI0033FA156B